MSIKCNTGAVAATLARPVLNRFLRGRGRPARGIEQISALGWWAYIIIIVVAVLGILGTLFVMGKSGAEATNLTQLATATMNVARTNAGYGTSELNTVLYDAGVLPTSYTYDDGTVYNQWNGTVTVTGVTSYFTIEDTEVPSSECVSIAQKLSAGSIAGYLDIGGTQITSSSDVNDIDTACGASNSAVSGDTVTITMYVGTTTAG